MPRQAKTNAGTDIKAKAKAKTKTGKSDLAKSDLAKSVLAKSVPAKSVPAKSVPAKSDPAKSAARIGVPSAASGRKGAVVKSRAVAAKALPAAQTSGAQPLDLGPLPNYIGYRLRRAQISAFDDFIRCTAAAGLRPAQFSTLMVIDANPGSKQTQVAHALGIKGTNFVAMINELEKRDLVERRASDRRSHALHMTAKGRQALARVIRVQAALEREYDRALGAGGRAKLMELLEALCEARP